MIRPLLLAHRGACRLAPENSLAAFDAALQQGCDGFEFDLRLSGAGEAVVCHDPRVRGRLVARSTLAQLNAPGRLGRFLPAPAPLPTLDEVLMRYAGRAFLDIEIKVAGLEKNVLASLREHPPLRGYVVSSFLPEVLRTLHEMKPDLPLGYIFKSRRAQPLWRELPVVWVMPHHLFARRKLVDELRERGKKVCVWTVNSRRVMRQLAGWGVDAIISDDVQAMQELRQGS